MFEKFLREPQALTKNVCLGGGLILPPIVYRPSHSGKLITTLQSTTFSFNTTVLPPKNQFRLALYAVCFLPYQSLTKLCDFPYPISGLI